MRNENFWISSVAQTDNGICLSGLNFKGERFEVTLNKYLLTGPVDFDHEEWDEGSFLVWDGDDLWHIEITLTEKDSTPVPTFEMVSDTEFQYDSYGLSPIIFSQITGAIVANL